MVPVDRDGSDKDELIVVTGWTWSISLFRRWTVMTHKMSAMIVMMKPTTIHMLANTLVDVLVTKAANSHAIFVSFGIEFSCTFAENDVIHNKPTVTFTKTRTIVNNDCRLGRSLRTFLAMKYLNAQIHVMLLCDMNCSVHDNKMVYTHNRAVISFVTRKKPIKNNTKLDNVSFAQTKNTCVITSNCSFPESYFVSSLQRNTRRITFSMKITSPEPEVKTKIAAS